MYKNPVFVESLSVDSSNNVPIDQFPVQDFNMNSCGFPSSDVTLLMKSESEKLYNLYASRLQEINLQDVDTSSMSDEDIIRNIIPQKAQLASEFQYIADRLARSELRKKAIETPINAPVDGTNVPSSVENA